MTEQKKSNEQIAFERAQEICNQPAIGGASYLQDSRSGIAVVYLQQLKALEDQPKLQA